jgi:hypothetical protein
MRSRGLDAIPPRLPTLDIDAYIGLATEACSPTSPSESARRGSADSGSTAAVVELDDRIAGLPWSAAWC